jgi:hypothetical protein
MKREHVDAQPVGPRSRSRSDRDREESRSINWMTAHFRVIADIADIDDRPVVTLRMLGQQQDMLTPDVERLLRLIVDPIVHQSLDAPPAAPGPSAAAAAVPLIEGLAGMRAGGLASVYKTALYLDPLPAALAKLTSSFPCLGREAIRDATVADAVSALHLWLDLLDTGLDHPTDYKELRGLALHHMQALSALVRPDADITDTSDIPDLAQRLVDTTLKLHRDELLSRDADSVLAMALSVDVGAFEQVPDAELDVGLRRRFDRYVLSYIRQLEHGFWAAEKLRSLLRGTQRCRSATVPLPQELLSRRYHGDCIPLLGVERSNQNDMRVVEDGDDSAHTYYFAHHLPSLDVVREASLDKSRAQRLVETALRLLDELELDDVARIVAAALADKHAQLDEIVRTREPRLQRRALMDVLVQHLVDSVRKRRMTLGYRLLKKLMSWDWIGAHHPWQLNEAYLAALRVCDRQSTRASAESTRATAARLFCDVERMRRAGL